MVIDNDDDNNDNAAKSTKSTKGDASGRGRLLARTQTINNLSVFFEQSMFRRRIELVRGRERRSEQ